MSALVSLTDLESGLTAAAGDDPDRGIATQRVFTLVQALRPLDRQVMMLYLEGCDAGEIADVTGLSTVNVATKVHRIKQLLTKQFHEGNGR